MSIEQPDVVDLIGTDPASGETVLTISDHLEWQDERHIPLLRSKLNAYMAFIKGGQLFETRPTAQRHAVRIELIHQHEPDASTCSTLQEFELALRNHGVAFSVGPLPPGY
jgi:hypothetical protein